MALVAALFGFADFFGSERIRSLNYAWLHMVGNLIAVVVAAINWYLRFSSAEPASAVLQAGVWLSLATLLLLLFNGWMGWQLVYRHHVAVADAPVREPESRITKRAARPIKTEARSAPPSHRAI